MRQDARRQLLKGHVVWVTALLLAPAWVAAARDSGYTVGKWAYKRLSSAHEHLANERYAEALELADEMRERSGLNEHEQALMWQTYGYIHAGQEKLRQATDAFERALALDALPEGAALNTRFNLGQLLVASERYKKAIKAFEQWFAKAKSPAPSAHYLMAMTYAQVKDHDKALRHAQQAVSGVSSPPETHLQLLVSLHFLKKQFVQVAKTLKRLLLAYPKKTYYLQLSATYAELNDEARALAVLELADMQGYLATPQELLNFSRYYLQQGVPFRAAKVVEEAIGAGNLEPDITTLSLLATSLVQAREFRTAIEPLENAAELSGKGTLYVQLAQLHLGEEQWAEASNALTAALKKGGLVDEGNAHLMLGIAYHSAKKRDAARRAFREALAFDKSKTSAEQWLTLMRRESEPGRLR